MSWYFSYVELDFYPYHYVKGLHW